MTPTTSSVPWARPWHSYRRPGPPRRRRPPRGLAGALVVGFALSPIGPVGEVARVSASRSLAAPGGTVVPFVLGTLAASVVALGVCVLAATRRRVRGGLGDARAEGVRRAVRPEIADGVAAALAGGRAILLPGAAVVAVAAVVATRGLRRQPQRRHRHAPTLRLALAGRGDHRFRLRRHEDGRGPRNRSRTGPACGRGTGSASRADPWRAGPSRC